MVLSMRTLRGSAPVVQLTVALVLGAVCSTVSREAEAFAIDTGSPDLAVRWDNTVRVNAAWRVEKIDDTLVVEGR